MGVLPTFFVRGALGGQEIVLDALELELEVAVSQHVGVGNWNWVFYKSSNKYS